MLNISSCNQCDIWRELVLLGDAKARQPNYLQCRKVNEAVKIDLAAISEQELPANVSTPGAAVSHLAGGLQLQKRRKKSHGEECECDDTALEARIIQLNAPPSPKVTRVRTSATPAAERVRGGNGEGQPLANLANAQVQPLPAAVTPTRVGAASGSTKPRSDLPSLQHAVCSRLWCRWHQRKGQHSTRPCTTLQLMRTRTRPMLPKARDALALIHWDAFHGRQLRSCVQEDG